MASGNRFGRGTRGGSRARGPSAAGDGRVVPNAWRGGRGQASTNAPDKNVGYQKFLQAKTAMESSIQKHLKSQTDYESSEEEDELENDTILDKVLNIYNFSGGKTEDLGRTRRFLEETFLSGATTCLICIASVKRQDAVWNCETCFCCFHIQCIQQWARDSISLQRHASSEQGDGRRVICNWCCPKCRSEYKEEDIPTRYYCFCGNTEDPPFQPWLVPHSCGETCNRPLQPHCGHSCLLLCHPGPCPPCPKTVQTRCYCGKRGPESRRCSGKSWSCGRPCGKTLSCGLHICQESCHQGACPSCSKESYQKCMCGQQKTLRPCSSPQWQCDKVCGKLLSCSLHRCEQVCHPGSCRNCPGTEPRTCPCGKSSFQLPCTEETPTCGDTCGKVLECGTHLCSQRCHKDKCGNCLQMRVKSCRCGSHKKEFPCYKEFLCEVKCKRTRSCNNHSCNKKCCDGNCPPCEKQCGRTLRCGNHKCASVCHRGFCYPCPRTVDVQCNCGETTIVVPCGMMKRTKPPKCNKPCRNPPACHHLKREHHRCHFGECPPCRQLCDKARDLCSHPCVAACHSAVKVQIIKNERPAGPWEKQEVYFEIQALPCPDCMVPVPVTCLGAHETANWPCHIAQSSSCQRPCGRTLACGNHSCSLLCHTVEDAKSDVEAGSNCEVCEVLCSKPRPERCKHRCLRPCHPDDCPPCTQMIKLRCHCGLNQLYVECSKWSFADEETEISLQCCNNQCPKNYACGHRCRAACHRGECPDADLCNKKVKMYCPCKRQKKDFSCALIRSGTTKLLCDDVCEAKKKEELEKQNAILEMKRKEEEKKNQEELEWFEKKFQGKRKNRNRRQQEIEDDVKGWSRWKVSLFVGLGIICSFIGYIFIQKL